MLEQSTNSSSVHETRNHFRYLNQSIAGESFASMRVFQILKGMEPFALLQALASFIYIIISSTRVTLQSEKNRTQGIIPFNNNKFPTIKQIYFMIDTYVKVAEDLKHLRFFLKKLISRQREASESASFFLIPITHNIKGFHVQICRRGSPGAEI